MLTVPVHDRVFASLIPRWLRNELLLLVFRDGGANACRRTPPTLYVIFRNFAAERVNSTEYPALAG
eukprot:6199215-Pleurochrysis_carterae.AAC.3